MEEVLIDRPADDEARISLNRPDSEDRNEGVRAFREKRKPTYQGK